MITYPDVSHYQDGLDLTGAVLVVCKATQGATFTDWTYPVWRAQAAALGIPLVAYHWLDTTDPAEQAKHCFDVVGPDTPLMIDDEQGVLAPAHTLAFVAAYRARGGRVVLEYAPRWLWAASGEPDLRPFAAAGLLLVASHYGDGPASPAGWAPYGGVTPAVLQYTDAQPFNGRRVDFNAYPGTLAQLRAHLEGDPPMPLTDADAELVATKVWYRDTGPEAGNQPAWLMLAGLRTLIGDTTAAVTALTAKLTAAGGPVDVAQLAADIAGLRDQIAALAQEQADLRARLAAAYTPPAAAP